MQVSAKDDLPPLFLYTATTAVQPKAISGKERELFLLTGQPK